MTAFLGITGFIALVTAIVFVRNLAGKAAAKVTAPVERAVFSGTYASGLAEAKAVLKIASPVAPLETIDKIVDAVGVGNAFPGLKAALYLKSRTGESVVFAFGSRAAGDVFIASVRLATSDTGSSGTFQVNRWHEQGAIVQGAKDMARLRDGIGTAVQELGGSATAEIVDGSVRRRLQA
ncbi:hypothetical protein I6A60_00105 [Frankia sp. AgB1.9]|uniref:hypothetical protein n=1 Tax=unclassified Frankia TaxID=2632575 RepID=UPI00193454DF|nr:MULTISPECIES: hypothetical protein [unclassified Frankia]MBL7487282.1 hypothetical protein [Frankia sp. AgW1.1]MBL7546289.1 hypothetical protein [Frankia sp. AgB1.9]MBL7618666.1 hypothetical protein [Frankia sp. AgB1.8]